MAAISVLPWIDVAVDGWRSAVKRSSIMESENEEWKDVVTANRGSGR